MQKSIIPMFAVMCVAIAMPARSNASNFAHAGACDAINHTSSIPCADIWESYCDESKPICQSRRRRRHAFGCGPLVGSACRKSSCHQEQYGCDAGFNTFGQRNEEGIIRSRPLPPAPRYIEPWPAGQDPFDSFEHTHGGKPTQNVLPQDRRVPQDFVPAAPPIVLPPNVPPQNTLPHDDLSITRRRPRRLTVRQVSRHSAITTPSHSRYVTKSLPPVPQSLAGDA